MNKKTNSINIRVSDDEKKIIKIEADKMGLSLGTFIRFKILNLIKSENE